MNYEMWGEANIYTHEDRPEISGLLDKFIKGNANPREKRTLKKFEIKHVKQRNLLMDRLFDRFASAFTQSPSVFYMGGSGIYNPGLDVNIVQNMMEESTTLLPGNSTLIYTGNVPELIGVGSDGTFPTVEDRGLYSPYPHIIPGGPYNYRNTYNSEEGQPGGFGTRDNNVIRMAATWEGTYVPGIIREVGLFSNIWMLSTNLWDLADTIDFTQIGASPNRAWEILNLSSFQFIAIIPPNRFDLRTFIRDDSAVPALLDAYTWNQITQTITYNGTNIVPPGSATLNNKAIIAFSPRYDHQADPGVGSNVDFQVPIDNTVSEAIPQLLARAVLPTPITKLITQRLTIIWLIYIKRVI